MCLRKVYNAKPAPRGIGYKVMDKVTIDGQQEYMTEFHLASTEGQYYKPNVDYRAIRSTVLSRAGADDILGSKVYTSGFHIYKSKAVAKELWLDPGQCVVEVAYTSAHTQGIETVVTARSNVQRAVVLVADSIRILRELRDAE